MTVRSARPRTAALAALCTAALLSACSAQSGGNAAEPSQQQEQQQSDSAPSSSPTPEAPKVSAAVITSNIKRGASDVDLTRTLKLKVASGTLRDVAVSGPDGAVKGTMSPDKTRWSSTSQLSQDTRYRVTSTAVDPEGLAKKFKQRFHTRALSLDEQTFPSFAPLDGQTVGVGMPVIIRFDVPVTDRSTIQQHVQVQSTPAQKGAFHWISDNEVHWRPKSYWKPGTDVTVKADIGGVPAGGGIYGQKDREMTFHVGDSMVSKVDIATHQMRVFRNGKLARTIPVTTGEQPKFTTRSGVKVIVEKFRHKRMNSETIGINPDSADGYDLDDVEYAMRLTYTGEFVHAAPWSVGSQGVANVSHGCTGLSPANAAWLYDNSKVGDVVEYTGSDKGMTLTNGFGDWNEKFSEYKTGSALS